MAKLETEMITDIKLLEENRSTKTMYSFWNKNDRAFRNKTEQGRRNDY